MAFTKITAAGIGSTETVTLDGLSVINNGSFGGNLTVGGVLTYEDVTNVDSVGLITARNGIVVGSGITLSKDGDIFATGITTVSGNVKVGTGITLSPDGDVFFTGIATGNGSGLTNLPAANLTGTLPAISGANLTNLDASDLASGTVPTARLGSGTASSSTFLAGDSTYKTVTGTTIVNNADNRVITGSDTANAVNAEANLSFSNNELTVHQASLKGNQLAFSSSGTAYIDHKTNGQDIQFRTSVSSTNDTVSVKITSVGNLAFASGKGIDFSATGDGSGTASSEILDDYEEGTWTGSIQTGSANINNEWYVKIGSLVIGGGSISAFGDTSSGNIIQVNGLPYSSSGAETGTGAVAWSKCNVSDTSTMCRASGSTLHFMRSSQSTGSWNYVLHSNIVQGSGSCTFGFNYITTS